jgi:hypothetical protein
MLAAQELQGTFVGKSHRYVASDELKISEIVKIWGTAIDKPESPWVQFSDEETFAGMTSAGILRLPRALMWKWAMPSTVEYYLKILTSLNLTFGEVPGWLTLQRNLLSFINLNVNC